MIVFMAFIVAVMLAHIFLPMFNTLSGKQLFIRFSDYQFFASMLIILVLTGIAAGGYPALYLSSFHPVKVLKGGAGKQSRKNLLRKTLVIIQFIMTIGFISGTIVIFQQMNFMQKANLGFKKENLVYLKHQGLSAESAERLKNDLLRNPNIVNVTTSSELPTGIYNGDSGVRWEDRQVDDENIQMQVLCVDCDFLKTYQMEMAEGRFFSKDFTTDTRQGVVVNEAAVKAMGMQSAVGKGFEHIHENEKIIGVIRDFNFKPLSESIEPLIIRLDQRKTGQPWFDLDYLTLRMNAEGHQLPDLLNSMRKELQRRYPHDYFEFHFLDESIERLYMAEQRLSKIIASFTLLAIFIANLGLIGLVSVMTSQRMKEIGIRKVVGASVSSILMLLTREVTRWIVFANVIAWPLAWLAMRGWLQNYAFRIELTPLPFLLAGIAAFGIALVTVGWQAIKAAMGNPVQALKYE